MSKKKHLLKVDTGLSALATPYFGLQFHFQQTYMRKHSNILEAEKFRIPIFIESAQHTNLFDSHHYPLEMSAVGSPAPSDTENKRGEVTYRFCQDWQVL